MTLRLRVLVSAYACEPNRGSEPGIGWQLVHALAERLDVWVLTRANNRAVIEAALEGLSGDDRPRFVYVDLPAWLAALKNRVPGGVSLYYYVWQLVAARVARRLHAEQRFDVAHHATFVRYWSPVAVAGLGIPYVIGPVGGGEAAPRSIWPGIGAAGYVTEIVRDTARWFAERDPLVRGALARASRVLAATAETKERVERLGSRRVDVEGVAALSHAEINEIMAAAGERRAAFTFVSVGRLLHWKGFHLGLQALARMRDVEAEYWIVGDGPFRGRLERLARELGVAERVRFLGMRSRAETLMLMGQCHVLVHPSLHDSGGFVCLEALAAGLPVVCLDLGGPASMVHPGCAVTVRPGSVPQVIGDLRDAMQRLLDDRGLWAAMGREGRTWVRDRHEWGVKADRIAMALQAASASAGDGTGTADAGLPE